MAGEIAKRRKRMRRGSVVMLLIRILWDSGGHFGNKNFSGLNLVTGLCNGGGDEEEEKVVASIAICLRRGNGKELFL